MKQLKKITRSRVIARWQATHHLGLCEFANMRAERRNRKVGEMQRLCDYDVAYAPRNDENIGTSYSLIKVSDLTSYRLNDLTTLRKAAFTLAEVLITLTVIGIVAAMTISNLVQNYQEKVIVTQLKKTYAMLSQATELVKIDYPFSEWNLIDTNTDSVKNIYEMYKKYLRINKDCGCGVRAPVGCWSEDVTKRFKGNDAANVAGKGYIGSYACAVRLADGTNLTFDIYTGTPDYLAFYLDFNGDKKPNEVGRDVFVFKITDKGTFSPFGLAEGCKASNSVYSGFSCADYVLKENKLPK